MKIALALVVGCLAVLAVSARRQGKYTTKYDNVNLDEILHSDRLLNNYFKCLMETGNCTPDGRELRESLPDAIENDCDACSEKQKDGSDKVIKYIRKNKTTMWAQLKAKYDPQNKYEARYPDPK